MSKINQYGLEKLLAQLGESIGTGLALNPVPVNLSDEQIDKVSTALAPEMVRGLVRGIELELKSIFRNMIRTNLKKEFSEEKSENKEEAEGQVLDKTNDENSGIIYWLRRQSLTMENLLASFDENSKDEEKNESKGDKKTPKDNKKTPKDNEQKNGYTLSDVRSKISSKIIQTLKDKSGFSFVEKKIEDTKQSFYTGILKSFGVLEKKNETAKTSEKTNNFFKNDRFFEKLFSREKSNDVLEKKNETAETSEKTNNFFKNDRFFEKLFSREKSNDILEKESTDEITQFVKSSEKFIKTSVEIKNDKPNLEETIEDDRRMEKQNSILEEIKKNTAKLGGPQAGNNGVASGISEGITEGIISKIVGGGKGGIIASVAASLGLSKLLPNVFGKAAPTILEDGAKVGTKVATKVAKPGLIRAAGGLKGGIAGILGGVALDYATDELKESGHEKLAAGTDTASSALSGASIGAMIGSVVPGIGTAIGGAVGGLAGAAYGLYNNWNTITGDESETNVVNPSEIQTNKNVTQAQTIYVASENVKIAEQEAIGNISNQAPAANISSQTVNNQTNSSTHVYNNIIRNPEPSVIRYFDRSFA